MNKAITFLYSGRGWHVALMQIEVSSRAGKASWEETSCEPELPKNFIHASDAITAGVISAKELGLPFIGDMYEGLEVSLSSVEILALAFESSSTEK